MIDEVRFRGLALATVVLAFVFFAACGGGDKETGAATPAGTERVPPLDAALFPVVLESDVRVTAQADGSGSMEEPVEVPPPPGVPPDTFEYRSPDETRWASFRDGTLYVREDGGEPVAIAEIPSTAEFANMGWSPDGGRLVVDASFEGQTDRLYVVNVDGSGLTNVAEGLPGDAYAKSWSPDGQQLAFGVYRGPLPEGGQVLDLLYVVAADGSGRTALGEFSNPQGDGGWDPPQWSPDGSYLAVLYSPDGGIRVFDTSGGPPFDIATEGATTKFSGSTTKLSWSADGRSLAFDRYDPSARTNSVVIVEVAAPNQERVLTQGYWPRWSPTGDRIAFKRGEGSSYPGQVFTIGPDGTGEILIGDMGPESRFELTWSDDGTQIEFIRAASGDARVYALDLRDGTALRHPGSLAQYGVEIGYGSLSPDGDRVAFTVSGSKEGGPSAGWYVMELISGAVTKVTDDARTGDIFWTGGTIRLALSAGVDGVYVAEGDRSPPRLVSRAQAYAIAWSPDGERLALVKDATIRVVTLDGTEELVIPTGVTAGSGQVSSVDWSPDGTRLLYETSRVDAAGNETYGFSVAALDGSAPRDVVTQTLNTPRARWSPGGETIGFSRPDGTSFQVLLIDANGSNERVVASLDLPEFYGVDLDWSPDQSMLAAVAGQNETYVFDVESGATVLVATNAGNCLMRLLGWSKDSQVLYLAPRCALGGV